MMQSASPCAYRNERGYGADEAGGCQAGGGSCQRGCGHDGRGSAGLPHAEGPDELLSAASARLSAARLAWLSDGVPGIAASTPRTAIFNHTNVVSLSHPGGPGVVTVSAVKQVSEKQQWTT
jgi:hypothetical protein